MLYILTLCALGDSCLFDTATYVCDSGRNCDPGQICAVGQDVCVNANGCGNGRIDPGEICDDGNIMDGDGCSHDCRSDETCGNGIVDPVKGESCDDGNLTSGDGCSADCAAEVCGDHIVNQVVGEVCDDGNKLDGDGCSADCHSNETCGNGVVDTKVGEECELPAGHPQGVLEDTAECNSNCTLPRCGDGHFNDQYGIDGSSRKEQCDGGMTVMVMGVRMAMPMDSRDCNADCTLARCGDKKINIAAGEMCDDGTARDSPKCNGDCTTPRCGDGHTNPNAEVGHATDHHHEECDDGVDTENCNGDANDSVLGRGFGDCRVPACGDGYVNPMFHPSNAPSDAVEQCDIGNSARDIPAVDCPAGSHCSSDCTCQPDP